MIFEFKRLMVTMNKPVIVGFSILDTAKLTMYKLHYDTFKRYYGDRLQLLYTDTDSFIYSIQSSCLINDLKHFASIMDFRNYPTDHELFSDSNKKRIGFIKDEMGGKPILEFIGLKPKLYSLMTHEGETKRAKGCSKSVLTTRISFNDYLNCLERNSIMRQIQTRIGSDKHDIAMMQVEKIVMSPLDDKRFHLDIVNSLAFGHVDISKL